MNSITTIDHNKFQNNQCASNGCKNQGSHNLRVLFLNKVGYFCESCKIGLLEDKLVEETEEKA
jgi:hypothetical protein